MLFFSPSSASEKRFVLDRRQFYHQLVDGREGKSAAELPERNLRPSWKEVWVMVCDSCHQREASIHVSQVTEGNSRELHLCEACAEASGLNVKNVMSIPEILFGMAGVGETAESARRSCPQCHLRGTDFRKGGRLGCEVCYRTFEEELNPMLAAMHKGVTHKGKVPEVQRHASETEAKLGQLRRELDHAVKREDYEEAARVRDRLREAQDASG